MNASTTVRMSRNRIWSLSRHPRTTRNTTTATSTGGSTSQKRCLSKGWTGARGFDLTNDTLDYDKEMGIPKINVSGYDDNGFMVKNMIQKVKPMSGSGTGSSNSAGHDSNYSLVDEQNHSEADSDGSVYMNGSIIVFPTACFLWKVSRPPSPPTFQSTGSSHVNHSSDVSKNIIPIESLASIALIRPHVEYLFIGCNDGYGSISNLNDIQYYFRHHVQPTVVVEQMQLYNAIGTFNLLNAEDRSVAAALMVDSSAQYY